MILMDFKITYIIHIPSQNIWEHLGQFGDLDIKTSQGSKLGKK